MLWLCDTNTLLHNISDQHEREALTKLLEIRAARGLVLFRSQVNRVELANTKDQETRDNLEADYMGLDPVPIEESISGFQLIPDHTGSFIRNPVSDLDSPAYRECRAHGVKEKDTLLILRAVANAYGLLTRDKGIIKRRGWLEERFPGLKIRLPSELLRELCAFM
jgi:hypothetical protein